MKVHFDLTPNQAAALWIGPEGDAQNICPVCHKNLNLETGNNITEASITVKEEYGEYNADDLLVHYTCAKEMMPKHHKAIPKWFVKALSKAENDNRISFELDDTGRLLILVQDKGDPQSFDVFAFVHDQETNNLEVI